MRWSRSWWWLVVVGLVGWMGCVGPRPVGGGGGGGHEGEGEGAEGEGGEGAEGEGSEGEGAEGEGAEGEGAEGEGAEGEGAEGEGAEGEGAEGEGEEGEGEGETGVAPGGRCRCDADCRELDPGTPPRCVVGICMAEIDTCRTGGTRGGCPAGFRCWELEGAPLLLCWPDCARWTCAGTCDAMGSCVFDATTDCDPACGTLCRGAEGEGEGATEGEGEGATEGEGEGATEGEGEGAVEPLVTVRGTLRYQYRSAELGWGGRVTLSAAGTSEASGLQVVVAARDGQVLGQGVVANDGSFTLPLSQRLGGGEFLLFTTLWVEEQRELVKLAVLRPRAGGNPTSLVSAPWSWSFAVPASGQVGNLTITEAQGSGAIFVFQFNLAALLEVAQTLGAGQTSRLRSLAVLWSPGVTWDCGACYSFWESQQIEQGPNLEQTIFVSGDARGSSCWGWPALLHEFGHYVSHNYSRDDNPGGVHYLGEPIPPPQAWSEGWASFFGASQMSRWQGSPYPIFWDIQEGDSFWIDYDAWDQGGVIAQPDPWGGIDQPLDECYVTAQLWHLWLGDDIAGDGAALGSTRIMESLGANRLLSMNYDRGETGVDLVDYLDTLLCSYPAFDDPIHRVVVDEMGFPLAGQPLCP